MESTEIISPPSVSAKKRATSDFPAAVGPAMRMAFPGIGTGWFSPPMPLLLWLHGSERAWQQKKKDQPGSKNSNADQLCRRQHAEESLILGIVTPEQFDKGSQDGIANQVGGKNLS